MFMGEYNHTIDEKGRLIIPAKFREQLGKEFVITRGMDECLFVYPLDAWKAFEEKLSQLPITVDKNARMFARFFQAPATMVELDKQGRANIPTHLRKFAGLEKDVVLTGVLDKVEIWDADKWQAYSDVEDMDAVAEQMYSLGISI